VDGKTQVTAPAARPRQARTSIRDDARDEERDVGIESVSLVVQRGPERLWDWHHIGTAWLGARDLH
jgi:hypothetical protein